MRKLSLLAGVALVLAGCCTNKGAVVDDPEVAARCPPVRDLLSKNYHRDAHADLAIFDLGGAHSRTGAILTGAEADRVYQMDGLCRAWVRKDLSGKDYAKMLLQIASATLVQTSSPEDRGAAVEAMIEAFKKLKDDGLLPAEFDPGALKGRVAADGQLTQAQLDASLKVALASLPPAATFYIDLGTLQQGAILSRLESVDSRLARLEVPKPTEQPPPSRLTDNLEIYFSTASAELTYDAQVRLREAAKAWVSSGSIVTISGYSDPRGDEAGNRLLSMARAAAVADMLEKLGVKVDDVRGEGVGSGADDDLLRVVRIKRL